MGRNVSCIPQCSARTIRLRGHHDHIRTEQCALVVDYCCRDRNWETQTSSRLKSPHTIRGISLDKPCSSTYPSIACTSLSTFRLNYCNEGWWHRYMWEGLVVNQCFTLDSNNYTHTHLTFLQYPVKFTVREREVCVTQHHFHRWGTRFASSFSLQMKQKSNPDEET